MTLETKDVLMRLGGAEILRGVSVVTQKIPSG